MQIRCRVGVFHQAQGGEIFRSVGFERRAGFQAVDKVRNDAIEARLVAAILVVTPAPRRGVVVLLTCGANQCTTVDDASALAKGIFDKLKQLVPATGGGK